MDEQSIAKAREALKKKMNELAMQPPTTSAVPAPGPTASAPESPQVSKKPPGPKVQQPFPPIQPPPSAVSATKQQRLAELLRKYKADEITPEEYHQQRAKILSEP